MRLQPSLAALLFTVTAACGPSPAMTEPQAAGPAGPADAGERRAVAGFDEIALLGSADLVVRDGDAYQVEVIAEPDARERITTRVEGRTLIIDTDTEVRLFCFDCGSTPTVRITLPELRALRIDGSGDADIVAARPNGGVALGIQGSGNIHYRGRTGLLRVAIEGSGDIDLAGAAGRLEAAISGSGALQAGQMLAGSGSFAISGSGDMDLRLGGGEADFVVEGSGDIRWSGEAKVRRTVVDGSGEVSRVASR